MSQRIHPGLLSSLVLGRKEEFQLVFLIPSQSIALHDNGYKNIQDFSPL